MDTKKEKPMSSEENQEVMPTSQAKEVFPREKEQQTPQADQTRRL